MNSRHFQRKKVFKGTHRRKLKIEWVEKPKQEKPLTKWEKFKNWFYALPIWSSK